LTVEGLPENRAAAIIRSPAFTPDGLLTVYEVFRDVLFQAVALPT
jgi:hypothetical protein